MKHDDDRVKSYEWAQRWLPDLAALKGRDWFRERESAVLNLFDGRMRDPLPGADDIAAALRITSAEVQEYRLNSVGAVDRLKAERLVEERAKKRARMAAVRAARGAKPIEGSMARTKPWEAHGISRATYYRWIERGDLPPHIRMGWVPASFIPGSPPDVIRADAVRRAEIRRKARAAVEAEAEAVRQADSARQESGAVPADLARPDAATNSPNPPASTAKVRASVRRSSRARRADAGQTIVGSREASPANVGAVAPHPTNGPAIGPGFPVQGRGFGLRSGWSQPVEGVTPRKSEISSLAEYRKRNGLPERREVDLGGDRGSAIEVRVGKAGLEPWGEITDACESWLGAHCPGRFRMQFVVEDDERFGRRATAIVVFRRLHDATEFKLRWG